METLLQLSTILLNVFVENVSTLFDFLAGWIDFLTDGCPASPAFAVVAVAYGKIPKEVLAGVRRWHGTIDNQFGNIDNVVNVLTAGQAKWPVPEDLLKDLTKNRDDLSPLIAKCRSNYGSPADRTVRNALLKTSVGLCLTQIKSWSFTQYYAGTMTMEDVHLLGFLLPGEIGGVRERTEGTDALADVKVTVLAADNIRAVVDQATGENAALVKHGWPPGVKIALIVIMSADGKTEILQLHTTRLHNRIVMPEGSRGKQFMIKAAFLKHIDDKPMFGAEPTFSMPLTTEELTDQLERQHAEDMEARDREVERLRLEIERLQAGKNSEKA
jgi:hypothetical protein